MCEALRRTDETVVLSGAHQRRPEAAILSLNVVITMNLTDSDRPHDAPVIAHACTYGVAAAAPVPPTPSSVLGGNFRCVALRAGPAAAQRAKAVREKMVESEGTKGRTRVVCAISVIGAVGDLTNRMLCSHGRLEWIGGNANFSGFVDAAPQVRRRGMRTRKRDLDTRCAAWMLVRPLSHWSTRAIHMCVFFYGIHFKMASSCRACKTIPSILGKVRYRAYSLSSALFVSRYSEGTFKTANMTGALQLLHYDIYLRLQ